MQGRGLGSRCEFERLQSVGCAWVERIYRSWFLGVLERGLRQLLHCIKLAKGFCIHVLFTILYIDCSNCFVHRSTCAFAICCGGNLPSIILTPFVGVGFCI